MKTLLVLWSCLASRAFSSPAIVWNSASTSSPVYHSSEPVQTEEILAEILTPSTGAAPSAEVMAVVFLLARNLEDGTENLSNLAAQGSLPGVAAKYEEAQGIYHHVLGVSYSSAVVRQAQRTLSSVRAMEVTLPEFSAKLSMMSQSSLSSTSAGLDEMKVNHQGEVESATSRMTSKRFRALSEANVLVVFVDANTDPSEIDSAVVSAVEHASVGSVVLTAVRSVDEVKMERDQQVQRRRDLMEEAGRRMTLDSRRLANVDDQVNNNQNSNNGVYYVSMTPNIMAGLLFFFLFFTVAWIGLSCMGMIAGQDVYVNKMPSIGREA